MCYLITPYVLFLLAVKLAKLVRRLVMVREVASSIPIGAVFAHVNIELAGNSLGQVTCS